MSNTRATTDTPNDDAPTASSVRALARAASKHLGGGTQRTSDPVRRETYDIDSDQARIVRPLGKTVEDVLDTRNAILSAIDRYRGETIAKGHYSQGGITRVGYDVIKTLLTDEQSFDFWSGTNDAAETEIARKANASPSQVRLVKKELHNLGLIDWVRRSVATGLPKAFGVIQRITATCLYYFTPEKLTGRLAEIFAEEVALVRVARERIERATGKSQRKALEQRKRRRRHIPALINPRGWAAALRSQEKASSNAAEQHAAEEARSLAFMTAIAQTSHLKPI